MTSICLWHLGDSVERELAGDVLRSGARIHRVAGAGQRDLRATDLEPDPSVQILLNPLDLCEDLLLGRLEVCAEGQPKSSVEVAEVDFDSALDPILENAEVDVALIERVREARRGHQQRK